MTDPQHRTPPKPTGTTHQAAGDQAMREGGRGMAGILVVLAVIVVALGIIFWVMADDGADTTVPAGDTATVSETDPGVDPAVDPATDAPALIDDTAAPAAEDAATSTPEAAPSAEDPAATTEAPATAEPEATTESDTAPATTEVPATTGEESEPAN